jgi:hypothetical protein
MMYPFENHARGTLEIPRASFSESEVNATFGTAPPFLRGAESRRYADFVHYNLTTGDSYTP